MKILCFNGNPSFSAIRKKAEVIKIILKTCELIVTNSYISVDQIENISSSTNSFVIIDKMSRLFVISKDKMFSIHFPFTINTDSHSISFLNQKISASILSILQTVFWETNDDTTIESIIEILWNETDEYDISSQDKGFLDRLALFLISFEPGYIRYDFDLNTAQEYEKRGINHIHPKYHFDIYYSNATTFKVGIENEISYETFIDVLNKQTTCYYLSKPK